MKYRTIALLAIFFLLLLFAALNWEAFSATTTLNLVIGKIEAPLGGVMLATVALLTLVYLLLLARQEAAALLDSRSRQKELDKTRKLAESREESRIRDLEEMVRAEFGELRQKLDLVVEFVQETDVLQGRPAIAAQPSAAGEGAAGVEPAAAPEVAAPLEPDPNR